MSENEFVEPCVESSRPAAGTSQDISHVLASVFKDVYSKDMGKTLPFNRIQTNADISSYHDTYVKELWETRCEYEERLKEAELVKTHMVQARARAAAKESLECERLKADFKDACDHQPIAKSTYCWCVDDDLFKRNNLISPGEYLDTQKPQAREPAAGMHLYREPQHDRNTLKNSPKKIVEIDELDERLTFESSSDAQQMKRTNKEIKPRPKWMGQSSAKDQAEGWEKLQSFKQKSFLRNPSNAQQRGTLHISPKAKAKKERDGRSSEIQSSGNAPAPVFQAKPSVISFTEYSLGQVYESTLKLQNVTSTSRHVRVIPPTTSYFSINGGRFPSDGGIIAPGLSCKYTLRFTPDSLGDYEDFIMVETDSEQPLKVPIKAHRPPPVLTLPRVVDCGHCLVGGVKIVELRCQNVGLSPGDFCIIAKDQWPASNLRSLATTYYSEQPPFAVGPSLFTLQPGETTRVEVVFFPTTQGRCGQLFTMVCDNCQVKDISVEGEGQMLGKELVSVFEENKPFKDGEAHNITGENSVHFPTCNPHSVQQKRLVLRNNAHLELSFHWQILKHNLHPVLPGEILEPSRVHLPPDKDDVFHMSPATGLLSPCQVQEFLLTFSPKELKDYHSVFHLVLGDVPLFQQESNSVLPVQTGSKMSNVTIMEIEVKGSTEPYCILLEPSAILVPGENFIYTTIRKQFKIWNYSKTFIMFQWQMFNSDGHVVKVEPSAGRIEENECFDFALVITGGKPGKVETSLVCNIPHQPEPLKLPVEVSFKGPAVTTNVPWVDFGLVRLGESAQTTLILTNTTPVKASWTLREKVTDEPTHRGTQVLMEPCCGVLPPFASCSVELSFSSGICQMFDSEVELTVEAGTGFHLCIRADVQSPQVCLLNHKLLFSDLYIGVPTNGNITLFNQTLLPSQFNWKAQLQGKQAALCTASFEPSSGTLGPSATMEITVSFTSHTDLELADVAALCEVQGMNFPLILGIMTSQPKTLSVSYSLPGISHRGNDENHSVLMLDFGEDVHLRKAVTKQLLIKNESIIPADFTIKPEFFDCNISAANSSLEKRPTHAKTPLHFAKLKKVEAKANEEFVSGLLAHGKGAAFLVSPDSGQLGPFETKTVDVTAYSDMWGEYRDQLICKVGDLEPMPISIKMTVKGCPLYFQMTGPRPDDQHQGPIIYFGTHQSGGDTVSKLLRINNPSMFDILMNWETYNIEENNHKPVDVVVTHQDCIPLKDADGNELDGAFGKFNKNVPTDSKKNHNPAYEGTRLSLQSVTGEKEREFATEEEEGHCLHPADSPYCITPKQTGIPAKGRESIHVSFTPLNLSESAFESRCVGVAFGFMSLNSEKAVCIPGKVRRKQGLDLQPFRLDLQATIRPMLMVQMKEDGGVLYFNASAGDLLMAESDKEVVVGEFSVTKSFQLRNTTEMPLCFQLETRPPFSVLTHSEVLTPPTLHIQQSVLHPQLSMKVKVAFHCSLPLLDLSKQTDEDPSLGVKLIHNESGQKLRFLQNLLIQHSNNTLQKVPLCAHLDLPTLSVSTDLLNFGICCVGQIQTKMIKLYCHGANTSWKSIIKSDDPHVFELTPNSGFLQSKKDLRSSWSQCLEISFTPSQDKEFMALVVIQSPLVKMPLTLQLQGAGSFEGV
ncbi:deleted in lung and esophageal cancer protein 1 [Cyprinodon tularosa]|uniref:deleted in lung and esophageal cancer protein 1 n=1 Tax=Cyprinodon tularosa TaxID=77115 RepID=UPI0018E2352E|nr:deleted in lung and esophageal cancer protein 1 [Cyprinodon tularosa]